METISDDDVIEGSGDDSLAKSGFISENFDPDLRFQEWNFDFSRKRRSLGDQTLYKIVLKGIQKSFPTA